MHTLTQQRFHKCVHTIRIRTRARTHARTRPPRPRLPIHSLVFPVNPFTGTVGGWLSKRIGKWEEKALALGLHKSSVRRAMAYKNAKLDHNSNATRCLAEASISTHFALVLCIDSVFTKHQTQGRLQDANAVLAFQQLYTGLGRSIVTRIDSQALAHSSAMLAISNECHFFAQLVQNLSRSSLAISYECRTCLMIMGHQPSSKPLSHLYPTSIPTVVRSLFPALSHSHSTFISPSSYLFHIFSSTSLPSVSNIFPTYIQL